MLTGSVVTKSEMIDYVKYAFICIYMLAGLLNFSNCKLMVAFLLIINFAIFLTFQMMPTFTNEATLGDYLNTAKDLYENSEEMYNTAKNFDLKLDEYLISCLTKAIEDYNFVTEAFKHISLIGIALYSKF